MKSIIKHFSRHLINCTSAFFQLDGVPIASRLLVARVRAKGLTFLPMEKIAKIVRTVRRIEKAGLPGAFIEAGCAMGGSSIIIASCKSPERKLSVYDVFGMIPPPTVDDPEDVHLRYETIKSGKARGLSGQSYYGYREDLRAEVERNFCDFGIDTKATSVSLIEGLVQETLEVNERVAFAHIDVDWHDPVKVCLERIHPHLVIGGSIILDDYDDWGGCRKAVDTFLNQFGEQYVVDANHESFIVTKIR